MKFNRRNFDIAAFSNIFTQLFGYLVPLLAYPYLGKALGASAFGKMSFWIAISGFISILTEYGFRYSAARQIAQTNSLAEKSVIFWNVQWARIGLLVLAVSIVLLLVLCLNSGDAVYFVLSLTLALGGVIFPTWYLVGNNEYKRMALFLALPKLLGLALVFAFVQNPSDLGIAIFLQGLPFVLSGLWAQIYLFRSRQLRTVLFDAKESLRMLFAGKSEFFSVLAMSSYQSVPVIFIGLVSSHTDVANYAIADKIVQAAKGVTTAWGQTIFTRNSGAAALMNLKIFKSDCLMFGILNCLACVGINFIGFFAVLFLGEEFSRLQWVLLILSVVPILAGFSNVAGIQTLMPLNAARSFMISTMVAGTIGLAVGSGLGIFFGGYGMAIGVVLAEFLLASMLTIFAIKLLRSQ